MAGAAHGLRVAGVVHDHRQASGGRHHGTDTLAAGMSTLLRGHGLGYPGLQDRGQGRDEADLDRRSLGQRVGRGEGEGLGPAGQGRWRSLQQGSLMERATVQRVGGEHAGHDRAGARHGQARPHATRGGGQAAGISGRRRARRASVWPRCRDAFVGHPRAGPESRRTERCWGHRRRRPSPSRSRPSWSRT